MIEIIKFNTISKIFSNKTLIDSVSFSVKKSEITTLIGPNGAGKTTIAKLILGLEAPSTGTIDVVPNLKIGYVPQKLDFSKNLPITAKQFLSLLSSKSVLKKHQYIKDFINLDQEQYDQDISLLSRGQLQKLLIGTTLLDMPDLLVLDEPTRSLDIVSEQELYQLINKMKHAFGMTIFMISHDLHTVMKNSDQVICLNHHVCCSGRPNDINNDNEKFFSTLSEIGLYNHNHDHKH